MTRTAWQAAADAFAPPDVDVWTPLGYTPNPGPQTELHELPIFDHGGPWDVLYGGAMGGGKSKGLLFDAIAKAARWAGIEVWIVRSTYPELERDLFPMLEAIRFGAAIGARWNGSERTLRLSNSARIRFLHSRNTIDAASIRGECQYLIVDERTLIDPKVIDMLALRIRSGGMVPIIGIRSGTNPGGPGHSKVKNDFIDPAPLGRKRLTILDDETGEPVTLDGGRHLERFFLPARISDNPRLDRSYKARFAVMGADTRAAYRDGDWSKFEGMRFGDFDPRVHIIRPEQLSVPLGGVRRGVGIDYGSAAPFAAVWGAIIAEQLVVYRELHQPGLTPSQQAKAILAAERDGERKGSRTSSVWIDPSTWERDPEKPMVKAINPDDPPPGSIADRYRKAGVPVRKAFNPRVAGWSLIEELLLPLPDGRPGVVFYETCVNVIRSISSAPRDPSDPEDVDDKYTDDHAADAFRYLVAGLTRRGTTQTPARERNGDRVSSLTGGLARAGF